MFVQRDNAIGVALFAALLGRFLPRLGPLRVTEAASFFSATPKFLLSAPDLALLDARMGARFACHAGGALGGADGAFPP